MAAEAGSGDPRAAGADATPAGPGGGVRPGPGEAGRRGRGVGPVAGATWGPVAGARGRAGRALTLAVAVLLAAAGLRWARAASRAPLAALPDLAADSVATLLVVLRSSDCDSYRPLMAAWDRLHREEDVRVVGAVIDGPEAHAARDSLERRLDVAFPLRHDVGDAAEKLALRLGYGVTPLSVLLDPGGRPRTVVPPVAGRGRSEAAFRVAAVHLELLGGGGDRP